MEIIQTKKDAELTIELKGRLETTTAPQLETVIKEELAGVTLLTFDLSELQYVSSAGLRVLLTAQKTMNRQGAMRVLNANEIVGEIFDITGFSDIFDLG